MESGNEILTIKEVCDLLADPPDHGLQADQEGQDFQLPNRPDWRFRRDWIMRWMAEKSISALQ
jgi:hypothetical protein